MIKFKSVFPDSEWFEQTFGFRETILNVNDNFDIQESDLGIILYTYKLNKTYLAGKFSTKNISSFTFPPRGFGTFSILSGLNNYMLTYSIPEFYGATFQVETNFNCLSNISSDQNPLEGIKYYIYNNLGGSQASVSTAASSIFRNYYLNSGSEEKINLLKQTPLPIEGGFCLLGNNSYIKEDSNLGFDISDLSKYEVGVQENCQVILTRKDENNLTLLQQSQIVHQVFVSSLNLSSEKNNNLKLIKDVESFLLEAEYKSTILSAWNNSLKYPDNPGSKKCFLTAIGYDMCNVPLELVFNAIMSCKELIINSGLDVCLIANDRDCFCSASRNLNQLVIETSGRIE